MRATLPEMDKPKIRYPAISSAAMLVLMPGLSGCGYNELQSADESTSAGWSEVVNQYQRRADLITNLVETVKAFALQEKSALHPAPLPRVDGCLSTPSSQSPERGALSTNQHASTALFCPRIPLKNRKFKRRFSSTNTRSRRQRMVNHVSSW
jgi:hypothetical protein